MERSCVQVGPFIDTLLVLIISSQYSGRCLLSSLSASSSCRLRKRRMRNTYSPSSVTRRVGRMEWPGFLACCNPPSRLLASTSSFISLKKCQTLPEMLQEPCSWPLSLAVSRKNSRPTQILDAHLLRGLLFILVILFCLTDPATVLGTSTGMPIVELFLQSTKNRAGTTILALMLSICFINGTSASITSASRLLFAMARDRGILFHDFFSHIQEGLDVPVRTIMLCYVFNLLFGLLYLGPTVAFSAYVASCTIFLNISYASPVIALLVRGRGILVEYQTSKTPAKIGRAGAFVNTIAAAFVVITSLVSAPAM